MTAEGRAQGGHVVLYVEDNRPNLELLERLLAERPGLTLVSAPRGAMGVDLARERRPDLVLLDLHLPDISGEEVLRRLRNDPATRDTPVIIVSADASRGRIRRLLDAGAQAYFTKPVNLHELLRAIADRLPPVR